MGATPRRLLLGAGLLAASAVAFIPGGLVAPPHVRLPAAGTRRPGGGLYAQADRKPGSGTRSIPRQSARTIPIPRSKPDGEFVGTKPVPLPGVPHAPGRSYLYYYPYQAEVHRRAQDVIGAWATSAELQLESLELWKEQSQQEEQARDLRLAAAMLQKLRGDVEKGIPEHVFALTTDPEAQNIKALATVTCYLDKHLDEEVHVMEILNSVGEPGADWEKHDGKFTTPLIHGIIRLAAVTGQAIVVRPWDKHDGEYYKGLGFEDSEPFAPRLLYSDHIDLNVTNHVLKPFSRWEEPPVERNMQMVALEF